MRCRNGCGYIFTMNEKIITEEELAKALRRYIYGENIMDIAPDYDCYYSVLARKLKKRYGDFKKYRSDSVMVYLQLHTVTDTAKHFNLTESGVKNIVNAYFPKSSGTKRNTLFYRDITPEELCHMYAPYEQDIIRKIEESKGAKKPKPKAEPVVELTKDERTARAREAHKRARELVKEGREHIRTDKLYRAAIRKMYG